MRRSTSAYLGSVAAAVLTVACGSGSSPLGPSPLAPQGATIKGTLVGVGAASASLGADSLANKGGIKVSVAGTSLTTSTSASGEFTIDGVPAGTATLHFEGQGCDAALTVSGLAAGQVLSIKISVSGKNAKLVSGDDPADGGKDDPTPPPDSSYSFSGVINTVELPEICVSDVTVVTNAKTVVINALGNKATLGALKVGQKVAVEGRKKAAATQNGGSYKVVATRIKIKAACSTSDVDGQPNGC